jgi:cob(I)alamin adenosyltransferase
VKIYTRTGDKGTTSLFTGQRVSKSDSFIEALGEVDEGNSSIGLAISLLPKEPFYHSIKEQLEIIQHALFDVGAALATPRTSQQTKKIDKTRFDQEEIRLLEKWIDEMETGLPPLKTFILPGGHPAGATLHLARSIIRRAERATVPLYEQADVVEDILIYLNRLSDYLFVVSRFLNYYLKVPETSWQTHKGSSLSNQC